MESKTQIIALRDLLLLLQAPAPAMQRPTIAASIAPRPAVQAEVRTSRALQAAPGLRRMPAGRRQPDPALLASSSRRLHRPHCLPHRKASRWSSRQRLPETDWLAQLRRTLFR